MFFFIIFLFVLNFLIVVKNRAPEALPLLNPQEAPPQEARHHEDDEPSQKLTRLSDFKTVKPMRTTTKYND